MATIEVDFDVFKLLTAKRPTESVSYNDVLRDMLGLGAPKAQAGVLKGATFKDVFFPDGTAFRGTYKGKTYTAEIKHGVWINSDGTRSSSPSRAAVTITNKNWNGWNFWHCQMPGETKWRPISELRNNLDLL
jgi:hypothetical protein